MTNYDFVRLVRVKDTRLILQILDDVKFGGREDFQSVFQDAILQCVYNNELEVLLSIASNYEDVKVNNSYVEIILSALSYNNDPQLVSEVIKLCPGTALSRIKMRNEVIMASLSQGISELFEYFGLDEGMQAKYISGLLKKLYLNDGNIVELERQITYAIENFSYEVVNPFIEFIYTERNNENLLRLNIVINDVHQKYFYCDEPLTQDIAENDHLIEVLGDDGCCCVLS